MYRIIGADQKEYGPISAEQLRIWIAEGRVNANTQARLEGATAWQTLSVFPEFAMALGISSAPPPFSAGAPAPAVSGPPIEEVLNRDYVLDIGACLGNAWNLLTNNFGIIFGGVLIYFAIEMGFTVLGMIPLIGPLLSLANLFIVGALEAGLFYLMLKVIRRQPANAGDVFEGFRSCFLQLFLGKLVTGLLAGLCLIPAIIVAVVVLVIPAIAHHGNGPMSPPNAAQILIIIGAGLICLIPTMFLQTNWMFTLPLIIDRKMDFWPAMQASWKMVMKHWWQLFALIILVALINLLGFALCCVGVLFTLPLGFGALMYAYETIFTAPNQQAR